MNLGFLDELKRRNVFRVGAAYAIGAWLLAQATDLVGENFDLPVWLVQSILIALAIGLPVALLLAWVFEITPEGVKRESEVDRSAPAYQKSGRLLDRLIIVALIGALGYFVWEARFSSAEVEGDEIQPMNTELTEPATPEQKEQSIAVLPFENFSDDPADEYFADGLADTLLHKLAQLDELKVIARNSSFQFKGTNRDIREIGQILGVATILEGSVQRYGEQVRVIAQLIDTADGSHLWSETFDDRMENIFALQDRIAEHITGQLSLSISDEQVSRLLKNGTENAQAYDFYMLAMAESPTSDELTETDEEDYLRLRLLKRAVEADPDFAEAWAQIGFAYNGLAFLTESDTEFLDYIAKGREAAEIAISLDPELHTGYLARAYMAWRERRITQAQQDYTRALELNPNSPGAHSGLGLTLIRSDPERALELFIRGGELDPNNAFIHRQKGFALEALGRHEERSRTLLDAITRFPDEFLFYEDLAYHEEAYKGRPDLAIQWISSYLATNGASLNASLKMALYWTLVDDPIRAESWVNYVEQHFGVSDATLSSRRNMRQLRGEYAAVMEYTSSEQQAEFSQVIGHHNEGIKCLANKDYDCAQRQAQSVLAAHRAFVERGNSSRQFQTLGTLVSGAAYYGSEQYDLGREALKDLQQRLVAMGLMPHSVSDRGRGYTLALLYSFKGETQAALAQLQESLTLPGDAFIARDLLNTAPDYSPFFPGLKDSTEFLEWRNEFRARRAATRERMVDWEQQGELITPEELK